MRSKFDIDSSLLQDLAQTLRSIHDFIVFPPFSFFSLSFSWHYFELEKRIEKRIRISSFYFCSDSFVMAKDLRGGKEQGKIRVDSPYAVNYWDLVLVKTAICLQFITMICIIL